MTDPRHAKPYDPDKDIKKTFAPRINKRTKKPLGPYQAKHIIKPVTQASPVASATPASPSSGPANPAAPKPVNPNYTGNTAKRGATATGIAKQVYQRQAMYNAPMAPPGNAQKAAAAVKKYGAAGVAKKQQQQKKNLNKNQFKIKAFKSQHEGKNRLILEGLAKSGIR